ncbi:SAV_2336 N-terminal domain-related protein, partial [Streptomyces sp. NPDC048845]
DDGVSMLLWRRLATEVRQLMERSGAFRTIRIYGLDSRAPGGPLLGRRPFAPAGGVPLRPGTVTGPAGDTVVLVLSDGVGAAWGDGRMAAVLRRWSGHGSVAVLHALPRRLWDGSRIRAEPWRVVTRRRGAPNLTWRVADPVLPAALAPFAGVPVPVLEPTADAVGTWARLVTSPGASTVLPLLAAGAAAPPASRPYADTRAPGAGTGESVVRFREAASPEAYRLAAHLAAAAPLSVPVMRLVQRSLAGVDAGHLAEVFLGGLMRRADHGEPGLLPVHRAFDFSPAARRILVGSASARELLRTSRSVSARLAELAGRSPDFPAWLAHPAGTGTADGVSRPFGWVEDRLMRRLGVRPAPVRRTGDSGSTANTPAPAAPAAGDSAPPANGDAGRAADEPAAGEPAAGVPTTDESAAGEPATDGAPPVAGPPAEDGLSAADGPSADAGTDPDTTTDPEAGTDPDTT